MNTKEILITAFVILLVFPNLAMLGYFIARMLWMLLFETKDE